MSTDFNSGESQRALDSAIRAAVQHKRDTGEDVTDITRFLWQQYLPESTEMANIFATKGGGQLSGEKVSGLTNMIKGSWSAAERESGIPTAQLVTNDIVILKRAYDDLKIKEPKKWRRYEAASGDDNGFARFAREQLQLLKDTDSTRR